MQLRHKILAILSLVMAAYVASDFVIQRMTVARGFEALERAEAEKDALRVTEAIRREIADVGQTCLDWSAWDEMVDFVQTRNPQFVQANLGAKALRDKGIDLLLVCDRDGKVVWRHLVHPDRPSPITLRDFPSERLLPTHPLLAAMRGGEPATGLFLTEREPMLIGARPILSSERAGEPRGTVLLGRFLSGRLDQLITERTRVPFDFWSMDGRSPLPSDVEALRDELTASSRPVLREYDESTLHAYAVLNDLRGRPNFLVRASVERRITLAGTASIRYALLSTIAAASILLFALVEILQRIVLRPLARLTRHASEIGRTENFRAKLSLARADEIGILSREFDEMMGKLEGARAALVEAARTAGKSEIATGILHNVGNLLNSVNVSAGLVRERARSLRAEDMASLAKVLDENAKDLASFVGKDPRGRHLAPAVAMLGKHFAGEKQALLRELDALHGTVADMRELVNAQQAYAVRASVLEATEIPEVVRRALALTNDASAPDAALEVVEKFDPVPVVRVDRHKVLTILVNLIQNARQAMDASEGGRKRLTLEVSAIPGGRVRIAVGDTGVGIASDSLTRIFSLGFSTKKSGHGFGLHSAANLATELGGHLAARSDGPGRGATFVLEFPAEEAVVETAAAGEKP